MSRVGKKPIQIPEKVEVSIDGAKVTVKGPKGEISCIANSLVSVNVVETEEGKVVQVSVKNENNTSEQAQWGTARSCIANLIEGVTEGFSKQLEVNGVGYRVSVAGQTVKLNVGYSHEINYTLPDGVEGKVEENLITLSGIDKQRVGQAAAEIRKFRKPEPYKGKGIKYIDEVIRRKVGKAAKAGE